MQVSQRGIDLIKSFEGLFLKAYKDPVGIATIGYGTITYPNGQDVRIGDVITEAQAELYLKHEVDLKANAVNVFTVSLSLTQGQFDALVSFAYNLGIGALKRSTLLKKAKVNPNDPSIRYEFNKWVRAGGKILPGLVRRRKAEADLYFINPLPMLIEIKEQLPNGDLVIKPIMETGQFPEIKPKVGEQYTVYFESVVPDPIPEFNS